MYISSFRKKISHLEIVLLGPIKSRALLFSWLQKILGGIWSDYFFRSKFLGGAGPGIVYLYRVFFDDVVIQLHWNVELETSDLLCS